MAARHLVLASASPRRRALLEGMGCAFEICASDVDERVQGAPEEMVAVLSRRKARAVAQERPDALVLAADTLVAIDGEALGKPLNEADAARMLRLLSARAHDVFTGICLIDGPTGRERVHVERTAVAFRAISEEEIAAYIASGEPMDKAGAYGIQGDAGAFVEGIEGSFENVMGLPVQALERILKEF